MSTVTVTDRSALAAALRNLKLSGMLDTLEARLAQAHAGELGHLDFLQVLCQDEISRRETKSLHRRIRAARFETQATLEGFDFAASPKLPPPRSATSPRAVACRRRIGHPVRAGRVGKSHVAQALGHSRSGPAPTCGSSKPAASWPPSPADTPTAPGTNGCTNWSNPSS